MVSQKEQLLALFKANNNRLTLGYLLRNFPSVGYKAVARFSDLRKEGYNVEFVRGGTPSENLYVLKEEFKPKFDKDGQGVMI